MRSYFLVPEGLHQPDRLLHREGEGEVRSRVDLRHLNVLVAEIPLPLRVPTNLILSEDVRDQISWKENVKRIRRRQKQLQGGNTTFTSHFRCWMVWNYPWGSWGSWKAGQGVKAVNCPLRQSRDLWSESSSPLSGPVLRSIRWTGRCARCISVSSLNGRRTDGTIAGSGQLPSKLSHNTTIQDLRFPTNAIDPKMHR